jgi:WD40 repeat protein
MRDEGAVADLAIRADGKVLAAALSGGGVSLWDLANHERLSRTPDPARRVLFTGHGLVLQLADKSLVRLDDAGKRSVTPFKDAIDDWIIRAEMVIALVDGRLQRFDLNREAFLPDPGIPATAISSCGALLAVGRPGEIALLDTESLATKRSLKMDDAVPISVACSSDARLVAASGLDGAAHIYDVAGAREIAHLPVAGATSVKGLAFSPDGSLLHLQALGSLSSLGSARFVRIGDPASLPAPADGLQAVLKEHGVQLVDGEISVPARSP